MQISSGWMARIAAKVRAVFTRDTLSVAAAPVERGAAPPSAVTQPPVADVVTHAQLIDSPRIQVPKPRLLAARLASQAKLNVPVGKTPRIARRVPAKSATPRPKTTVEIESPPKVRSVYLPAKHFAAKARPNSKSNVVAMPMLAKNTKVQTKTPVAKLRLVA